MLVLWHIFAVSFRPGRHNYFAKINKPGRVTVKAAQISLSDSTQQAVYIHCENVGWLK
jgi:hypothetical protein